MSCHVSGMFTKGATAVDQLLPEYESPHFHQPELVEDSAHGEDDLPHEDDSSKYYRAPLHAEHPGKRRTKSSNRN